MNELALFAGAGGGILGSVLLGHRVVCAVEIDAYCREVLLRRQEEGHLDPFPVWDGIQTFSGKPWRGVVDIVSAGFPCQPFSVAGKRRGEDDERNLWPETARILGEVRPRIALLENVPGLLSTPYWGTILSDLAALGYVVTWDCVPAAAVGAPHRRDRLWVCATDADGVRFCDESHAKIKNICGQNREATQAVEVWENRVAGIIADGIHANVADAAGERERTKYKSPGEGSCSLGGGKGMADPERIGRGGRSGQPGQARRDQLENGGGGNVPDAGRGHGQRPGQKFSPETTPAWWDAEPRLGRVAHGVAYRLDRLKSIGNGQVPAVVRNAWELLGGP